jgi:hypothetical protein
VSAAPKVGDRVSYEDMANPRRTGTVVEVVETPSETPGGLPLPQTPQYRVRWDDRDEVVSAIAFGKPGVAGWQRVPKAKNAAAIADAAQEIAKAEAGRRRFAMKLLPADVVRALPPLYSQDGQGEDATVYLKFFGSGRWTWYVTEASALVLNGSGDVEEVALDDVSDPSRIGDIRFFGKVVSGLGPDCDELAYFSLRDLASVAFPPFNLSVERDMHFDPTPLRDAR